MINEVIIHDHAGKGWLFFRQPKHIIEAYKAKDVLPALIRTEELVNQRGLYAAGFVSYEAAPGFDPALSVSRNGDFPLVWFGIYSQPEQGRLPPPEKYSGESYFNWRTTLAQNEYKSAIGRIKEYISNGDTYQVNFTYRLTSSFSGNLRPYFVKLMEMHDAPYGAFLDTEKWAVCSASPELFFRFDGDNLISRPMKGTAARGLTGDEDTKQMQWLYNSEKNRAENIMIVDMVRNDMGRIAQTGSVRVSRLWDIEKYQTLWQMTSTVEARAGVGLNKIFRALFPAASITGAPKARTMRIIKELETTPRRVYTGSIGFICPGRRAQFNVAIRTILVDKTKKQAEYGIGGGIVWDSKEKAEFAESQLKAQIIRGKIPAVI